MSTETTKKKIKIDNGTEFAKVYTDKEVDSKFTNKQDTLVSGTNIKTLNGQSILGSGDLPISGGGGESVSPTLNLMNIEDGTVRTTITEQEKLNLEKGLYNQVYYFRSNQGLDGYSMYMPSRLFSLFEGGYLFSIMIAADENNPVVNNLEFYTLTIGEKNTNGEYPITIEKNETFNLGSDTNIGLYNHFIKITGTKDTTQVIARFTIQSSNNLVVDTPEKLTTLLGNEFELGCNGIYGNYNLTGLKKTADGTLNIIYNNGGAESLQSVARLTISISDTVKTV